MEAEFKKILDWLKKDNNIKTCKKIDLNDKFETELKNLEKLVLKLLNAHITITVDMSSNLKRLSYGMCIWVSTKEYHNKLEDAVKEKGKGFRLSDCRGVSVWIDLAFLNLCVIRGFNERHLVSVLLHELGHKVYVRSQAQNNYDYSVKYSTATLAGTGINIVIGGISIAVGAIGLGVAACLLQYMMLKGLGFYYGTKQYVGQETTSDSTAVSYGYGKETFEVLNAFYELFHYRGTGIMRLFNTLYHKYDSSKMRRDNVITFLEQELTDPNNSKAEKESIRKMIDELKKLQEKSDEKIKNECIDGRLLYIEDYSPRDRKTLAEEFGMYE
jgi:hypothetical protein